MPVKLRAQSSASAKLQPWASRIAVSRSPPPPSKLTQSPFFGPAISSLRLPLVPHRRVFLVLSLLLGGPQSASPTAAASARKAARIGSRSASSALMPLHAARRRDGTTSSRDA